MSDILFVTWDGGGNVPPALLIGSELQRRGHAVRFLGHATQRPSIETAGFTFDEYSGNAESSVVGRKGTAASSLGFLRMMSSRGIGADVVSTVNKAMPDLMVVDCLLFSALKAADTLGLTRAVLVHSLLGAVQKNMLGGVPGLVAGLKGIRPRALYQSADLVAVTSLRELEPDSTDLLGATHFGPALSSNVQPARPAPGTPRVLVSLSTTYIAGQELAVQRILDSLADLAVHGIVTTGPAVDASSLRVPSNVEVHTFVPHSEVMPSLSLVIGHGGHATTMLALAHDIPLVILPMNPLFDQPIIARTIAATGAGEALAKTASAGQIRAAVERMLADGPHRSAAAQLGAAIRAARGIESAADALEELATR